MFGARNLRQPKIFTQPLVVMVETFRRSAKTYATHIKSPTKTYASHIWSPTKTYAIIALLLVMRAQ